MTNWVAEFLAGSSLSQYPLARHGRNGLHFKKPGGGRVAVLQVKPVHYRDEAGDWRAIDTRLKDDGSGRFGAPGLLPRILPTGELQFLGKQYRQRALGVGVFNRSTQEFAEMGAFPNGARQRDRLVRETGIYRYELAMTERGVKDQVILSEFPAGLSGDLFVIQTEVYSNVYPQGESSREVYAEGLVLHPGWARDANGKWLPLTRIAVDLPGPRHMVYTGVPVGWLDTAAFPVTIDPSYSEQPDAADGLDNVLSSGTPTVNYGTLGLIQTGEEAGAAINTVSLIKFDLSSIPSDAIVSSATLSLWHYANDGNNNAEVEIFRLKRAWVESQSSWQKYDSANNWQTAGGQGANDRESTAVATTDLGTGTSHSPATWGMDAGSVEEMVSGAFTNNGWILQDTGLGSASDNARKFRSSDHGTAGERPLLEIEYSTQPQPSAAAGKLALYSQSIGLYDTRVKMRARARDVALTTRVRNEG